MDINSDNENENFTTFDASAFGVDDSKNTENGLKDAIETRSNQR